MKVIDLEKRIIYENDGVLVINKPYDMPSTGQSLEDNDCLQFWLIKRHGGMVWAIHQLDADTTGVNIFVTKKDLVPIYKKALEKSNSNKEYVAIIHGKPNWEKCEEFGCIGKVDDFSLGVHPSGKRAHSQFTVLDSSKDHSLVQAKIFTGRTHQIRIHLSHLGHPLVGEEWYCKPACKEHRRQALHCYRIELPQVEKTFIAPIAEDLKKLLKTLSLRVNSMI